LLDAYLTNCTD